MDAPRPTSELAADVRGAIDGNRSSIDGRVDALAALDALVARVTDLERANAVLRAQLTSDDQSALARVADLEARDEENMLSLINEGEKRAAAEAQVAALTAEVERLRDALEGEPEAVRLLSERVAALTQDRADYDRYGGQLWKHRARAAEAALAEAERRIAAALNALDIHDMSQNDEMGTSAEGTLAVVGGFLRDEVGQ